MVKALDVEEILVDEVKPGFTLVIPDVNGSPPRQFKVEAVGFSQIVGGPPMINLTRELVPPECRPWVREYPRGTRVLRLTRTHDDGTG
jgi:hypothetical protein